MAAIRSRSEERSQFDTGTRLILLEGDADEQERSVAAFDAKLNKIMWTLVGLLISVTTAAVLLAANLAVGNQSG